MKMKSCMAAFGGALCLLVQPVAAGQREDALAATQRGDFETALSLWKPLADQGLADAQFNLGVMYNRGQGVPQDFAEAAKWYRKAADQGVAAAQFMLGVMYRDGQGVPQNFIEAAKWYRKVAEQGDMDAQNYLGKLYAKGQGVPQDYVQSYMWFDLAVARGGSTAGKSRDATAKLMTPDQITQAQRLSREWEAAHPKP
jgi:uncharacterized protein